MRKQIHFAMGINCSGPRMVSLFDIRVWGHYLVKGYLLVFGM